MADTKWIPHDDGAGLTGTGNWNDTNHWDNGVPTALLNAIFDANSFNGDGQVVTINVAALCDAMNWTGATHTPTLAHSASLTIKGVLTGVANMIHTGTSTTYIDADASSSRNITFGTTWSCPIYFGSDPYSCIWVLQDALNIGTQTLTLFRRSLNINGQTVTCGLFTFPSANSKTLTLGAAVINCTGWDNSASALTIPANTSTINVSGTGAFAGGAIATYKAINLNGAAHAVSGAFTCSILTRNGTAAGGNSITFTSGVTVTCTTFAPKANSPSYSLTIKASTPGAPAIITTTNWTGAVGPLSIKDITATNAVDLSAIAGGSYNSGGNTNITFTWSNIAKVMGVDAASIATVKGVAVADIARVSGVAI